MTKKVKSEKDLKETKTIQVLKKENEELMKEECEKIIKSTVAPIKFFENNEQFLGIPKEKYILILESEKMMTKYYKTYIAMEDGIKNKFTFDDVTITLKVYGVVVNVKRCGMLTELGQRHLLKVISEVEC